MNQWVLDYRRIYVSLCLNELMHLCMIWITITGQCRSCKWIDNKCIGHIKWSLYLYDSDPRIYLVKEIFEKTPFFSNPYLGWCRYHKSNRPTISSVALSPGAIRPKQLSWAMLFVPTRSMTNWKKKDKVVEITDFVWATHISIWVEIR